MEIGIHNGALAIFIALNVLANATMSIPAAVYSLLMLVTAALFAAWVARGNRAPDCGVPSSRHWSARRRIPRDRAGRSPSPPAPAPASAR
jgi:hypothetical protein